MAISFEMDLDSRTIERNFYTILDFAADIGGLESIFTSAIAFMVTIWHWHGQADIFLAT